LDRNLINQTSYDDDDDDDDDDDLLPCLYINMMTRHLMANYKSAITQTTHKQHTKTTETEHHTN